GGGATPTRHEATKRLRAAVGGARRGPGGEEPLWFETTAADPDAGHAAQAVRSGVDLVLACGGDGTVTACAEGVAGSGVPLGTLPLGTLPLGTGNLLAHNLGLLFDPGAALTTPLTRTARRPPGEKPA